MALFHPSLAVLPLPEVVKAGLQFKVEALASMPSLVRSLTDALTEAETGWQTLVKRIEDSCSFEACRRTGLEGTLTVGVWESSFIPVFLIVTDGAELTNSPRQLQVLLAQKYANRVCM